MSPFFSDTVNGNLSGYIQPPDVARAPVVCARQSRPRRPEPTRTTASPTPLASSSRSAHTGAALFGEHFYYRYAFATTADLPRMLAGGLNRRGARVGLTLWTPAIR